jgi:hypothetical protein
MHLPPLPSGGDIESRVSGRVDDVGHPCRLAGCSGTRDSNLDSQIQRARGAELAPVDEVNKPARCAAVLQPLLLALAKGRKPTDRLFEGAARWWVHYHVTALCKRAKVPVVGPHSMRGLHATLATAGGATAEHVASALGHESFEITARCCADGDVLAAVAARTTGELLASSPRELTQKPRP